MDKELQKNINETINNYFWGSIKNISEAERTIGLQPNSLHQQKCRNNNFYASTFFYYFDKLNIDIQPLQEQIKQIIEERHARIKSN